MTKLPLSFVSVVTLVFLATLVTVTRAPGIGAPDGSEIVPEMAARTSCAKDQQPAVNNHQLVNKSKTRLIFSPLTVRSKMLPTRAVEHTLFANVQARMYQERELHFIFRATVQFIIEVQKTELDSHRGTPRRYHAREERFSLY